MSIQFKLSAPIIAGMLLIVIVLQYFWLPIQLEKAKDGFEKHTNELLISGETAIIQNLLERDFGELYSIMEQLGKKYKGRWLHIALYNESNKRIYPLYEMDEKNRLPNSNLIHITYPLQAAGTKLGHLDLDADWGIEKARVVKNINGIRNMIIGMIFLIILINMAVQFAVIYKPLKKLDLAANQIRHGDHDVELPEIGNDEIGDLTRSFADMLTELEFQRNALDQHASMCITDKDGIVTHVNRLLVKSSGFSREELLGKMFVIFRSDTDASGKNPEIWEKISNGKVWHGEICILNKSGENRWVNASVMPFMNEQGVPERYICILTDITIQKNAEEQLRYMANHDVLTGLATMRLGKEHFNMAKARADRSHHKVAILFIDLDGFKCVNDELGHDAGDIVLNEVAERFRHCVRQTDSIVRIGGDEFAVIIDNLDKPEEAADVAEKLIRALTGPFSVYHKKVRVGASIGIALYPDHAGDLESLLKCADQVMYAVKKQSKNNFAFYEDATLPGESGTS